MSLKKIARIVGAMLLVIVICMLAVSGCTSSEVTKPCCEPKGLENGFLLINGKSLSQFIFTEYQNRFDFDIPMTKLLANMISSTTTRGSDFDSAVLYFLDNIHEFVDEALLLEIIQEGNQLYDTEDDMASLTDTIKRYFDVRGEYGGINLIGHDVYSSVMKLKEYYIDTSVYTTEENDHLTTLLELMSDDNVPLETIISSLISDVQNKRFSEQYKAFLSYALYSAEFYNNNSGFSTDKQKVFATFDMTVTNPAIIVGALPGSGGGGSGSRCTCMDNIATCSSQTKCEHMKNSLYTCECPLQGGGSGGSDFDKKINYLVSFIIILVAIFF